MTRLLCFGDLHLGARAAHEREPGDGLTDQRHTLDQILQLAHHHNADAIVCAGDLFEGPTVPPEQYATVQRAILDSDFHGDVVAITGNGRHDCAMRDVKAPQVLDGLIDVHATPGLRVVGDTTLCLLPWVHPGRLIAARGGGDRDEVNADVAQLLLRAARDLRDMASTRRKVLVFHGSIEGAGLPTGIAIDEHASDILPVDDLADLGFDAIVAAHIHVPQDFHRALGWMRASVERTAEPFFYVGSPLPLNFGEGGYDHGVWLLDINDDQVEARFLPIDGRRFVTIDTDLTAGNDLGLDETDTVAAAIATHLPIDQDIVRVRIHGTEQQCAAVDIHALRPLLDAAHKSYLAFDPVRGQRARVDQIDEEIQPLQAVDLYADAHQLPDEDAAALRDLTADYLNRIGATA